MPTRATKQMIVYILSEVAAFPPLHRHYSVKTIGWNVSVFSLISGITTLWVIVLNSQCWKGQIDVNLLKWKLTLFSGSESLFLNCCINIKPVSSAQILIHPAEGATLHVLSCRSQRAADPESHSRLCSVTAATERKTATSQSVLHAHQTDNNTAGPGSTFMFIYLFFIYLCWAKTLRSVKHLKLYKEVKSFTYSDR